MCQIQEDCICRELKMSLRSLGVQTQLMECSLLQIPPTVREVDCRCREYVVFDRCQGGCIDKWACCINHIKLWLFQRSEDLLDYWNDTLSNVGRHG